MHKIHPPLLIVDVQPAYQAAFRRDLVQDILEHIRTVPREVPVVIVSVNEELSGDSSEDILSFWVDSGMEEALFERVTFIEKEYAFFRGWMDNGVPADEIVATGKKMVDLGLYDSRDMAETDLSECAPSAVDLADCMFMPEALDLGDAYKDAFWHVCGGGTDECLKEVELWMDVVGIDHERIESLTY